MIFNKTLLRTFSLSVIILLTAQFTFGQKVSIKGTISNLTGNNTVTLEAISPQTSFTSQTANCNEKGEFEIQTDLTVTDFFKLSLSQSNYAILILQPNDEITLKADGKDLFSTLKVEGSPETNIFVQANGVFQENEEKRAAIQEKAAKELEKINSDEEAYQVKLIKENLTSLASLMMIDQLDKDKYVDLYIELDKNLIAKYPDNIVVKQFHNQVAAMKFLAPGQTVEDITLNDENGKPVSLSSLKGKYVLIDFWATWCKPCLAEIPHLKKTYEEYKDKGFEVYSISLDQSREQWHSMVPSLPWITVIDDQQVSTKFQVRSIPFTILIDKEGKVIAKNLRGADVENLLAQYLK